MLTEKHKEVEAFLNKHKHRRYTATQIYEKVEGLRYPTEATEICNKLVELGLIREGFNGLRMTYQAWPSAMAVPNDAPKVKPMPQIKTRTGETLPAIETREEKPMELNDEHAAVEDRNQAVGLSRDWKAECIMLEASLTACRNQLDTAREVEQELGRANQRLSGEIRELTSANEQLSGDLREKSLANQMLHGELEGMLASLKEHQDKILEQQGLIGQLQHEVYRAGEEIAAHAMSADLLRQDCNRLEAHNHSLLNEVENDNKLISSLQRELEHARADRDDLSLDFMPGPLQLSRPFRAGVMFDENGNKVLLVDGSAVIVEYTAKQVGVILKAVDNLEWSGA